MSKFHTYADRLAAAGMLTESIRVRALARTQSIAALAGGGRPASGGAMLEALFPDATSEEAVALGVAADIGQAVEAFTKVDGQISIATAIFATAFAQRRLEWVAQDSRIADGARFPEAAVQEWVDRARELADRMHRMSEIMLDGEVDSVSSPKPEA